jgi:hypothetical protein
MAVYSYDRRADTLIKDVLVKLAPVVTKWLADPHGSKKKLFVAYEALTEDERELLAQDVRESFTAAHGGTTVIAYKVKGHPHHGGVALTTKKPEHLQPEKTIGYLVRAKDVMFHWGQEELPLGEDIIVLKPNAKPLPFE